MNAASAAEGGKNPKAIEFTIDGEGFRTTKSDNPARDLLTDFAKLDPADYDLGELHGHNPEPHIFRDDEIVHIHPGARYVSVRTGPGPVE
jgi:hypothetical protein